MKTELSYKAIEDNAGGLHLFVFGDEDNIIYEHSGYERNKGNLVGDIKALLNGADPAEWGGCEETPVEDFEYITSQPCGYEIVAASVNGVGEMYVNNMGLSALREFDLRLDE